VATPAPYRDTFFRLLGFLRPYRVSLVVSILLAVGSQAAAIVIAWLTGTGLANAITANSYRELYVIAGAVVLTGALRALFMAGRRLISGRQALGVEYDMRNALYAKLLRLSFGFYDKHQTGQLLSRATVDLQTVRFFLGYGLIFFFQNVLTVVSVTVVLFFFEWRLALIVLETRKSLPDFPEIVDEPAALGASGEVMLELRPRAHIQRVVDVIVDDSFVRMHVRMHISCGAASRAASRAL